MSELTSILALKALDGLTVRSAVIAQNIAHANTPGYQPLKVSFEDALVKASSRGRHAVSGVEPKIEPDLSFGEDAGVRMDLQMATASMTSTRYSALVEILSRQIRHMRTAVEGR